MAEVFYPLQSQLAQLVFQLEFQRESDNDVGVKGFFVENVLKLMVVKYWVKSLNISSIVLL